MALLQVNDLRVELGGQEVISNACLELDAGECIGIVGESGSGKSITCRAITGMLPRIGARVAAGSIRLGGRELAQAGQAEWRTVRGSSVVMVPQASLAGLDPVMRVGAQLSETIRRRDRGSNTSGRARELLEQVQLPDAERVLRSYSHQLSGGMRQRVMIALAIAARPDLLIADEPTTALDVTVQRAIIEMLDELRRDTGMGLVLVSHDLGVVRSIARQVYVMYGGMTVESGSTSAILDKPRHPYTQALLNADPDLVQRGARLTGLGGQPPAPDEWRQACRFAPRCEHVHDECVIDLPQLESTGERSSVACLRWTEIAQHA